MAKVESRPIQNITDFVKYLNGTIKDANSNTYAFMYPYGLPEGTDINKFIAYHKNNEMPRQPLMYEWSYVDLGDADEMTVIYHPSQRFTYNPLTGFSFNGTFKGTLNIECHNMRVTSIHRIAQTRGGESTDTRYGVTKYGKMEYINLVGDDTFDLEVNDVNYPQTVFQPADLSGAFEGCSNLKKIPDNINYDVLSLWHYKYVSEGEYILINAHNMAWFASGCGSLTEVPSYKNATNREDATNTIIFDTSNNCALMQQMCESCRNLRTFGPVLDFSKTDMTKTTEYYGDSNAPLYAGIFAGCIHLSDVRIKGWHGASADFTTGHFNMPLMSAESINYLLNNLISNGSSYTLTFSDVNKSGVSADAITNATNKGFTINWVEYYDRFVAFNNSNYWVFNEAQQSGAEYILENDGRTLSISKFKPNLWLVRTNNTDTTVGYLCGQTAGWSVMFDGLNENADIFETTEKFYKHSEVGGSGDAYGSILGVGILPSSMDRAVIAPSQNEGCTTGQLIELPFTAYVWENMTYKSGTTVQLGSETTALKGTWTGANYNSYGKTYDGVIMVMPNWSSFPTPYSNWQSTIGIYTNDSRVDEDGYITLETPIKITLIKEKKIE